MRAVTETKHARQRPCGRLRGELDYNTLNLVCHTTGFQSPRRLEGITLCGLNLQDLTVVLTDWMLTAATLFNQFDTGFSGRGTLRSAQQFELGRFRVLHICLQK